MKFRLLVLTVGREGLTKMEAEKRRPMSPCRGQATPSHIVGVMVALVLIAFKMKNASCLSDGVDGDPGIEDGYGQYLR